MKKMSKIYLPKLTEKEAYGFTHKTPQGALMVELKRSHLPTLSPIDGVVYCYLI